ncbi:hypothetical protein EYF80_056655 [Liparis tanakae]|uniref:Uncharacterized protein n=1 Tax=Liparis tanakae TaxID=230148 RepID=A0A4Z2EWM6_9TELE|nr:hypothetical protein EYF80_056655 [Liparis tanakae]
MELFVSLGSFSDGGGNFRGGLRRLRGHLLQNSSGGLCLDNRFYRRGLLCGHQRFYRGSFLHHGFGSHFIRSGRLCSAGGFWSGQEVLPGAQILLGLQGYQHGLRLVLGSPLEVVRQGRLHRQLHLVLDGLGIFGFDDAVLDHCQHREEKNKRSWIRIYR